MSVLTDVTKNPGDIHLLAGSFARHLRAENLSPATQYVYNSTIVQFADRLRECGMPTDVAAIHREHVEMYLIGLQDAGRSPSTVATRFKSLKVFFKWLLDEGEINDSPMARMRKPLVPDVHVPLLTDDQLSALLRTCEKAKDFEPRRDHAVMRLLIDTGMRRAECAALTLDDIDLDGRDVFIARGKGQRPRTCSIGTKATDALDRYLRARRSHRDASLPALWLGKQGALSDSGLAQILHRRGHEAGLGHLHLHQLRHIAAHRWLADGGQETDLMKLMGWRSRQMVSRYASSAADERARDAHRQRGLGDRL